MHPIRSIPSNRLELAWIQFESSICRRARALHPIILTTVHAMMMIGSRTRARMHAIYIMACDNELAEWLNAAYCTT